MSAIAPTHAQLDSSAAPSTNGVDPTATTNGAGSEPQVPSTSHGLEVLCGPLLNYKRMSQEFSESPQWHGSVLIVTKPGREPGQLYLEPTQSANGAQPTTNGATSRKAFSGEKMFEDLKKAFWRFVIDVPLQEQEATWEYIIPNMTSTSEKLNLDKPKRFAVPSKYESMRIMFHSCNGFSVGTDEEAWSGPAVWNDVLRLHAEKPFHVMIGGGDQIYNDGVRVNGPLRPWTDIGNPVKRREFPFNEKMRAECDEYYFQNYIRWYGTEPFATANAQIPQVNIWDDHDIIDGFGSYTDRFMQCSVFRGIGGVAHKYYLLFQHHVPPPVSTYTTDAPQTTHTVGTTTAPDPIQLKDTFVLKPTSEDPSFIIGKNPGPYVEERSRSIYCQLGKRIAFLGIDARTERTRRQINYPETYDQIFQRVDSELTRGGGTFKHLILLLGVPIAYPRLQWLENILQSPMIGPIKFMNKRFGVAGSLFNQFDGNVDLLDDLDDHYTARQHKKERSQLIHRLQQLAQKHSIRITILGGDVHLAALGRFYSNPALKIPAEHDFRYMPNIISSAITNHPPGATVGNLLAKRNKIHHLDHDTDETLMELFDKNPGAGQPGVKPKSSPSNHVTMPSRNYAIITESHSHTAAGPQILPPNPPTSSTSTTAATDPATIPPPMTTTNGSHPHTNGTNGATNGATPEAFPAPKNPREAFHAGELHAGTTHPAAQAITPTNLAGLYGLDVAIRVEINPSDREGHTEGYGLSIPALEAGGKTAQ